MAAIDASVPDRLIEAKMRAAGVGGPTIRAFLGAVQRVRTGERGLLPEAVVEPVPSLPCFEELSDARPSDQARLLRQLVVIKLNGGPGTSMGLDRAKSLIPVKGRDTFLDLIARQIQHLREGGKLLEPALYLMNSFSTQTDTLDYLRKCPALEGDDPLDFLQNKIPKIDPQTWEPISWPAQPDLEWCPPGHGDIYPALLGCGLLDRLLIRGIKYCFVSNSDNLGATVDVLLKNSVLVERQRLVEPGCETPRRLWARHQVCSLALTTGRSRCRRGRPRRPPPHPRILRQRTAPEEPRGMVRRTSAALRTSCRHAGEALGEILARNTGGDGTAFPCLPPRLYCGAF